MRGGSHDRQLRSLRDAEEARQPVGEPEHVALGDEQVRGPPPCATAAAHRKRCGHGAPVVDRGAVVADPLVVDCDPRRLRVPILELGEIGVGHPHVEPRPVVHRVADVRKLPVDDARDLPVLEHEVARTRVALDQHGASHVGGRYARSHAPA